jgi:hypothetical protein
VGVKRDIKWDGFKVHLTETCDADSPNMITNVLTYDATAQDITATNTAPDAFTARDLLPKEHLLDAGYIDGTRIVTAAREHGVTLTGPLHSGKTTSQAAGPYSQSAFTVDWDNRTVTCPTGKTPGQWADAMSHRGTPVVRIEFSTTDCRSCTSRPQCISSTRTAHRSITLRPRPEHEGNSAGPCRLRHTGMQGALRSPQRHRGHHLPRCPHRRHAAGPLPRTRQNPPQHQLTAAAINIARLDAWTSNRPRARTRVSHLAALRPAGQQPGAAK